MVMVGDNVVGDLFRAKAYFYDDVRRREPGSPVADAGVARRALDCTLTPIVHVD